MLRGGGGLGALGLEPSPEKISQEIQGWTVSPFSPAEKEVGCCRQDPPLLRHSGRRQRCGSRESWGLSAHVGAQGKGNQLGAEVQLRAEQFTHIPSATMNGDMRYSQ